MQLMELSDGRALVRRVSRGLALAGLGLMVFGPWSFVEARKRWM